VRTSGLNHNEGFREGRILPSRFGVPGAGNTSFGLDDFGDRLDVAR